MYKLKLVILNVIVTDDGVQCKIYGTLIQLSLLEGLSSSGLMGTGPSCSLVRRFLRNASYLPSPIGTILYLCFLT